ncbi:MAG: TIGR03619 family F420-dependent LLM class oxidoreductase [Actinobacteria bacterium]|nr:TIGR03619 family F420-dependent LLM class oxidoreductase [Actinomycetota bacterium]
MTASGTRDGAMRLGLLPPFSPETVGDPAYLQALATGIEAAGAESFWAVEHILVAEDYEPRYPYSADGRMPGGGAALMPDPLQVLAFVGAHTERLVLGTSVVVATQHPALILAKAVATLDRMSSGRVRLGVGMGWQIEEYRAVNVPYEGKGRRLDETIDAMRACWAPNPVSYAGTTVAFSRVNVDPKPVRPGGVPVIVGGSSAAAARRAGTRGDGWFPYVVGPAEVAEGIETIRRAADVAGRDPAAIEITVWPGSWDYSRGTDPELLGELAALGVDRIVFTAFEAGAVDVDNVAAFVARMRGVLDDVSD